MAEAVNKRHYYKVYDVNGAYITTWANEISSTPSFTWSVNGSMGEMNITLTRTIDDFGETEDVDMFNRVETWIQDGDSPNGTQIHSGFISSYDLELSAAGVQAVTVHVLSYTALAEKTLLKNGTATTIDYTDKDPADIMKDVLIKMAGQLTYNSASIENVGTAQTYTFKYKTCLEAIKKVLEFCPAYWYWYIDGRDILYLKATDFNTIDHTLFLGKEIQSMNFNKTIEQMFNTVYFLGGDVADVATYRKYTSAGSISEYGALDYRMQDTSVTDTDTAQTMSEKFLEENDHFDQEIKVTILDNNGTSGTIGGTKGYDIESFRPGQVVSVNHPRVAGSDTLWYNDEETAGNFIWDSSFWDYDIRYSLNMPMQIQQIDYGFDYVNLTLSTKISDLSTSVDSIERELLSTLTNTIPSTPS